MVFVSTLRYSSELDPLGCSLQEGLGRGDRGIDGNGGVDRRAGESRALCWVAVGGRARGG
jgi:hypothetical protein